MSNGVRYSRRPLKGSAPFAGREQFVASPIQQDEARGAVVTYVDGFVMAVPKANKEQFIEHARTGDAAFLEQGATRVLECWADDVPDGSVTDFRKAVKANGDETVVFSWIEWPDKATRDAGMKMVMSDPRMSPESNPMPFDAKRMIFGGFAPVVELDN